MHFVNMNQALRHVEINYAQILLHKQNANLLPIIIISPIHLAIGVDQPALRQLMLIFRLLMYLAVLHIQHTTILGI